MEVSAIGLLLSSITLVAMGQADEKAWLVLRGKIPKAEALRWPTGTSPNTRQENRPLNSRG